MLIKAIIGRAIDRFGKGVVAVRFPDGTVRGDRENAEVRLEILKNRSYAIL